MCSQFTLTLWIPTCGTCVQFADVLFWLLAHFFLYLDRYPGLGVISSSFNSWSSWLVMLYMMRVIHSVLSSFPLVCSG